MDLKFKSTRGNSNAITASTAIIKGIADDGGLYVPVSIPKMDLTLEQICNLNYKQLAYEVLKLFITDFSESELKYCIENAYDQKFDTDLIAPLEEQGNTFFLELFHGKTLAFKDMALSILPHFIKIASEKNEIDKKIVILIATSGDTGKAALEGFADVENTSIIVFYPENGVSDVQKMQMITQEGKNTCVIAIKGNFDDTQTIAKQIFNDKTFANEINQKGYIFSSANSINIGRLIPQIVYYFYAYSQMIKKDKIKIGDKINFTVPTGNFGNILAGFYAKQMGLPINKLICASNDNKVLYDFFDKKEYSIEREFVFTISPSMDILISSNLERLLFHISQDTEKTKELMESLKEKGKYNFDLEINDIVGEFATQTETFEAIKDVFDKSGYIIDTHTAVAYASYKKYINETNDNTKNIIISTASPYKFAKDVCKAIDNNYDNIAPFEALNLLSELQKSEIPKNIKGIDKKEILHKTVLNKDEVKNFIKEYLK